MSQANSIQLLSMNSAEVNKLFSDESTAPRIAKNIERISIKYREHIETEINEELDNQNKQAEKIQKLRRKNQ